jgi:signal transduction histidine kinase
VLRFKEHDQEDPERARLTPVPSLARLDELAAATGEAGLKVTCATSGTVAPLPPGVDLTAYRIIQEALTNALRHAPGATASVRVAYGPSHVTVEVTNTAPARASFPAAPSPAPAVRGRTGAAAGLAGPGYGLAGIAERVASCGGALSLGPAAGGGFTVSARLPLT